MEAITLWFLMLASNFNDGVVPREFSHEFLSEQDCEKAKRDYITRYKLSNSRSSMAFCFPATVAVDSRREYSHAKEKRDYSLTRENRGKQQ